MIYHLAPLLVCFSQFAVGTWIVARIAEPMIRRHLERWTA